MLNRLQSPSSTGYRFCHRPFLVFLIARAKKTFLFWSPGRAKKTFLWCVVGPSPPVVGPSPPYPPYTCKVEANFLARRTTQPTLKGMGDRGGAGRNVFFARPGSGCYNKMVPSEARTDSQLAKDPMCYRNPIRGAASHAVLRMFRQSCHHQARGTTHRTTHVSNLPLRGGPLPLGLAFS